MENMRKLGEFVIDKRPWCKVETGDELRGEKWISTLICPWNENSFNDFL